MTSNLVLDQALAYVRSHPSPNVVVSTKDNQIILRSNKIHNVLEYVWHLAKTLTSVVCVGEKLEGLDYQPHPFQIIGQGWSTAITVVTDQTDLRPQLISAVKLLIVIENLGETFI